MIIFIFYDYFYDFQPLYVTIHFVKEKKTHFTLQNGRKSDMNASKSKTAFNYTKNAKGETQSFFTDFFAYLFTSFLYLTVSFSPHFST